MKINRDTYPSQTCLNDRNDVFRGEHPDTRSDKEFIKLMLDKGFETPATKLGMQLMKQIRCINTGQEFKSITEAEKHFGLSRGVISEHIRRNRTFKFVHMKGLKFELIQ